MSQSQDERKELELKYRPLNFNELVGWDKEKESLLSLLNTKRTYLLYGKRGCGKCITKDSFIFTDEGIKSIDEPFKNINIKGFTQRKINIQTKEGMEFSSHLFQEETESTISIKDEYGLELEGTPEHPILCISTDCDFIFKKLSEIREGDFACLPRNINCFPKTNFKIEFCQEKKKHDSNSKKIIVPDFITPDIARLLGYIIANCSFDKTTIQMSTSNKKIQQDIKNILLKMGTSIGKIYDNKDFNMGGIMLFKLISYLMGGDDKLTTARFKSVPKSILSSNKKIQVNFLQGLIDCDSWMDERCLEYYTASKILADQVQMMLLNLGIFSSKKSSYDKKMNHVYWTLSIGSKDIDNYSDNIKSIKYKFYKHKGNGRWKDKVPYIRQIILDKIMNIRKELKVNESGQFYVDGKIKRFDLGRITNTDPYIKMATYEWLENVIPLLKKWEKEIGEQIIKKIDSFIKRDFRFSKIISTQILNEKKMVYDFTLPKNHNFISNGFINHNTTIGRLIAYELGIDNIDINEIDAATNTGVEDARTIKTNAAFFPLKSQNKIYIVDECHRLTGNAFDALLKTLEEPPSHCYFVLISSEIDKVPTTIKSRAAKYEVRSLDQRESLSLIDWICEEEKITISDTVKQAIIEQCEGVPREMIVSLDMIKEMKKDEDAIALLFSSKGNPQVIDLCRALLANSKWKQISEILKTITDEPENVRAAVAGYMSAVLLNGENQRAGLILNYFAEKSIIYTKKPALVDLCYVVTNN